MPPADQSFSALLEDLGSRGLLDEVLVVWMGEFGRTPRRGYNFSNNTNNVAAAITGATVTRWPWPAAASRAGR